jgi:hypothetical protein
MTDASDVLKSGELPRGTIMSIVHFNQSAGDGMAGHVTELGGIQMKAFKKSVLLYCPFYKIHGIRTAIELVEILQAYVFP